MIDEDYRYGVIASVDYRMPDGSLRDVGDESLERDLEVLEAAGFDDEHLIRWVAECLSLPESALSIDRDELEDGVRMLMIFVHVERLRLH